MGRGDSAGCVERADGSRVRGAWCVERGAEWCKEVEAGRLGYFLVCGLWFEGGGFGGSKVEASVVQSERVGTIGYMLEGIEKVEGSEDGVGHGRGRSNVGVGKGEKEKWNRRGKEERKGRGKGASRTGMLGGCSGLGSNTFLFVTKLDCW